MEINTQEYEDFGDKELLAIANNCPNMRVIIGCDIDMTSTTLLYLFARCPFIQKLEFYCADDIVVLYDTADKNRNKTITLGNGFIFKTSPKLPIFQTLHDFNEIIFYSMNFEVNDEFLLTIADNNPKLQTFELGTWDENLYSFDALKYLFVTCNELNTVTLTDIKPDHPLLSSDDIIAAIQVLSNTLTCLRLVSCDSIKTAHVLAIIKTCTKLTKLHVDWSVEVNTQEIVDYIRDNCRMIHYTNNTPNE